MKSFLKGTAGRTATCLLLTLLPVALRTGAAQRVVEGSMLPEAPRPQVSSDGSALQGSSAAVERDDTLDLKQVPKRMLRDEWSIVKGPTALRKRDLRWLLPVAGATAAALATDTHVMQSVVSRDPNFNNSNDTTSGALRDVMIAGPVALFSFGEATHHDHATEAGLLAGEAMVNAYVTDEGIKYITLRERPKIADARGHFWQTDAASDPSFVSGHAVVAWSSAAVLAEEYPKAWQQIGVYTLA